MRINLTTFLMAFVSVVQASDASDDKIVGGTPINIIVFPWVVAIRRSGEQDVHCGGSIVGSHLVLTAAHCFTRRTPDGMVMTEDPSAFEIVSGTDDLTSPRSTSKIASLIYTTGDETYTPENKRNDILLIKTVDRLDGTAVKLPQKEQSFVNMTTYAAGFGATSEGGDSSLRLLTVEGKILSDTECKQYYQKFNDLYDPKTMICAGDLMGGKDACDGDSGGPQVVRINGSFVLVGIISFGAGCARQSVPNVNTRITRYIHFLNKNIHPMRVTTTPKPVRPPPTPAPVRPPPPLTLNPIQILLQLLVGNNVPNDAEADDMLPTTELPLTQSSVDQTNMMPF